MRPLFALLLLLVCTAAKSHLTDVDQDSDVDDYEELSTQQEGESSEEEDSQALLEMAAGCYHRPHLHRCINARTQARLDRIYCFKHPHSKSIRCHRLDALEKLVFGRGGTSELARTLLRRCAGRKISKSSIIKLRRVLMKRKIGDRERNIAIRILRTCDLTNEQLLQLKRVLRIRENSKFLHQLIRRTHIINKENRRLKEQDEEIPEKAWLEKLNSLAGDGEEVKLEWVKKITDAAKNFDPCASVTCPQGSVCNHGSCWSDERCKNVKCGAGLICDKGECVEKSCDDVKCKRSERCHKGACISRTSCLGITCNAGQRCLNGECVDLTAPESCLTLKCPSGTKCVEGTSNTGKGARCVAPIKHESAHPVVKKKKPHYGPAQWSAGEWSECSKPCGQPGGFRTRMILCRYSNGKIAPDFECESSAQKPVATGDCDCNTVDPVFHAEPEPVQPEEKEEAEPGWKKEEWSKCSKRCEGTQTRNVTCIAGNGEEAAATSCSGTAPLSERSCGRISCSAPDYSTVLRICKGGAWTHCDCPTGYLPLTGGCDGTTWPHRWQYNDWNGDKGWLCGGHKGKKTVHVLCARSMGACRWQTSDGGDWHRQLCPANTTVISGGCNALEKPHLLRWQMKSDNGWLCGGWNGKKRTSTLCCDSDSMRPGCKTYTRRFGDWGHITCPKGTKLISGGCDADKPYLIRASRPINRRTWQCGGWGGNKLITVTCCPDHHDY